MNLSILEHNLREIHGSQPGAELDSSKLVSNFSGTIYNVSSISGRIWTWIFHVLRYIYGEEIQEIKFQQALRKTHEFFLDKLSELQSSINTYQTYLEFKSLDLPLQEKDYHFARREITVWNNATGYFAKKYLLSENDETAVEILGRDLTFTEEQLEQLRALQSFQALINIEGELHEPLPLALFQKIACQKQMEKEEQNELQQWIKKQNQKESTLRVRSFHQALKSYLDTIPDETIKPNLTTLELELLKAGLKVFEQKDPMLLHWRNSLKMGDILPIKRGTVTLDKQISHKIEEEDNNLVFTLQDDPNKVIIISTNQRIASFRKRINQQFGGVIPSAACLEISSEGDFAVYERLHNLLENREWVSNGFPLIPQELDTLQPVANLLKWMITNDVSPRKFSPKYLMFDSRGALKYAKVSTTEKFSHTALEDFVFQCAHNNLTVFRYLTKNSGLFDHRSGKFYLRILKMALNNEPCTTAEIGALNHIIDPKIIDRATQLYNKTLEIRTLCKNTILTNCHVNNVEKLNNQIKQQILIFYKEAKLLGRLWVGMENEIVLRCIRLENLLPRNNPN